MGREKILAILTAISLVGFASYSFFTKEAQNLQKEECVAQETNINNEIQNKIDEKEATKIVKNFLNQMKMLTFILLLIMNYHNNL